MDEKPETQALAILGAPAFAQAMWDTTRIQELAAPAYQARAVATDTLLGDLAVPVFFFCRLGTRGAHWFTRTQLN